MDPPSLPRFVLFGDSITRHSFEPAGTGTDLGRMYSGKAQVVNEGYSGYTTSSAEPKFQQLLNQARAPDAAPTLLITIFFGANDGSLQAGGVEPHVPIGQFEDSLREFVDSILIEDNLANTRIILITPPPINMKGPINKDAIGYRNYMSKKRFADCVMEVANSYAHTGQVGGLNFFQAMVDAALADQDRPGDWDADRLPGCGLATARPFASGYFTDRLHLGPRGYNLLTRTLMLLVLQKWPELHPDKL